VKDEMTIPSRRSRMGTTTSTTGGLNCLAQNLRIAKRQNLSERFADYLLVLLCKTDGLCGDGTYGDSLNCIGIWLARNDRQNSRSVSLSETELESDFGEKMCWRSNIMACRSWWDWKINRNVTRKRTRCKRMD